METTVTCNVCNCSYNDGCNCTARHIGISGGNACDCHQTECSSFELQK